MKHKVFVSYHHANDQEYRDEFEKLFSDDYDIFVSKSVQDGDISDDSSDQNIRRTIRDKYLKDSTVTILLVGTETKNRKHIDWELYSSMYNGSVNKQSGILVIKLPSTKCKYCIVAHGDEIKKKLYSHITSWTNINTRVEYVRRYPYMPSRIIDNLLNSDVKISVVNWDDIINNPKELQLLIDLTYKHKDKCKYNMNRKMKRKNS
jgi:hypothetical protein